MEVATEVEGGEGVKRIELRSIHLVNFKSARNLTVRFSSQTVLRGENEVGKTTVFDGFSWLLFDKDSLNKKDFGIKTTIDGVVIPAIDHTVEAEIAVDGEVVRLKKVYAEKWVKERGSADKVFSGHTTDHYIDGVPTKQKDYQTYISGIVDESLFKLLTSPTYFNEQLKWEDRRKILLDVCGDMSDADVIASKDSLAVLSAILGKHTIEDHRKMIAAQRAKINNELREIPARIDEATRSLPVTEGTEADAQATVDGKREVVASLESELNRLQTGGEVSVLENRIREIDGQMIALKNAAQSGSLKEIETQRKLIIMIGNELTVTQDALAEAKRAQTFRDTESKRLNQAIVELRESWARVNNETFTASVDDTCSACGQSLPAERVEEATEKALAQFNLNKSQSLEGTVKRANAAKADLAKLQTQTVDETLEIKVKQIETELESAKEHMAALQSAAPDVSADPKWQALQADKDAVATKLLNLRSSAVTEVNRVRVELMDAREALRAAEKVLAAFGQSVSTLARIEELKSQERALASEYERLEGELYLTEEFVKTKVSLLESKINSRFKSARFVLFETQINGGLAETCKTLYKGVPWGQGLNTGGCILVGLDIIATLQEHYGVSAPVFVDGRESLTSDIDMACQVVELIADEKVKTLKVEHKGGAFEPELQEALF